MTTVLQKITCQFLSLASVNRINALETMRDIFICGPIGYHILGYTKAVDNVEGTF